MSLKFGCNLTQLIMGCQRLCPLWCESQMYVIPFSFKDNSATSTDNEIIIGPLGPKFSLEGQMQLWVSTNYPNIQRGKSKCSKTHKQSIIQDTANKQMIENLDIWEKKHKTEELISQNTSKLIKWSAQRGWRQLDTSIAHGGGADKWTQVNCIKVKLGIHC